MPVGHAFEVGTCGVSDAGWGLPAVVFLLAFAKSFGAGWRGEWFSAQEPLITGHVPVSV